MVREREREREERDREFQLKVASIKNSENNGGKGNEYFH